MASINLLKLNDLTQKLQSFPAPADEETFSGNGYREYKMENGTCFAQFIHRSGSDVAVHRWFNSKGTIFPEHLHKERQWIIVYKGSMLIKKDGKETLLNAGDYVFNEAGTTHSSSFPEDCRYITVTIPPTREYPNGN